MSYTFKSSLPNSKTSSTSRSRLPLRQNSQNLGWAVTSPGGYRASKLSIPGTNRSRHHRTLVPSARSPPALLVLQSRSLLLISCLRLNGTWQHLLSASCRPVWLKSSRRSSSPPTSISGRVLARPQIFLTTQNNNPDENNDNNNMKRSPAANTLAPTTGTWFIPHLSAADETSLPTSVTAGICLADLMCVGF